VDGSGPGLWTDHDLGADHVKLSAGQMFSGRGLGGRWASERAGALSWTGDWVPGDVRCTLSHLMHVSTPSLERSSPRGCGKACGATAASTVTGQGPVRETARWVEAPCGCRGPRRAVHRQATASTLGARWARWFGELEGPSSRCRRSTPGTTCNVHHRVAVPAGPKQTRSGPRAPGSRIHWVLQPQRAPGPGLGAWVVPPTSSASGRGHPGLSPRRWPPSTSRLALDSCQVRCG
jgi:hypothetical protein